MSRPTFASVIQSIQCKACGRRWGIGCAVKRTGSTYCPSCKSVHYFSNARRNKVK